MKNKFLRNIFLISAYDFGIFAFMLAGIVFGMLFKLERFMLFLIPICSILCVLLYVVLIFVSIFKVIKVIISIKTKKIPIIFKIIGIDILTALPSYLIVVAAMTLARQ